MGRTFVRSASLSTIYNKIANLQLHVQKTNRIHPTAAQKHNRTNRVPVCTAGNQHDDNN